LFFLAKEEKRSSNNLAKAVDIFGKLLKMLAPCAYMRAGASVHPLAHPAAHLQLGR
jgi:hypothetical protein